MVLKRGVSSVFVVVSAALAVLSHPTVLFGYHFPDLHFLAWFAYVPLFLVVLGKDGLLQFRRLFLFGTLFHLATMYWVYRAMNTFGGLSPFLSILVLLILCTAMTLYLTAPFLLSRLLQVSLKLSPFWTLPLLWVSFEWMRGHWPLGGLPWVQAGYSQAPWISLIQIAEFTGVYGVTALVVWVNLGIVEVVNLIREKGRSQELGSRDRVLRTGFVALLMGGILLFGHYSKQDVEKALPQVPRVKIGLLQGDISQADKWLPAKAREILLVHQAMTREAMAQGAEITVWPEASFPHDIALEIPWQVRLIGQFPKDVVVGAITTLGDQVYNSSVLLRPGGDLAGAYHKQHLVPYGEYIPLKSVLPFLRTLTDDVGEFNRGDAYVSLHSGRARIGSLICYEDIFPEISRHHTRAGANLLINLTNDAWYGDSSALPQHLSFSPFRAVENRRSLVRATNNGLTASVDPLGRIRETLPPFGRGILFDDVSLVSLSTFYVRWGDVFVYGCMGIVGIMLLLGIMRKINP